jgi:hypothetical protein
MMSRVWSHRSSNAGDDLPQPTFEEDGIPFYGPDPYADPYGDMDAGYESDGSEPTADDIAAMAREARAMAQMMGEPLDAEFDTALRHVEQGADPDDVFGELDAFESAKEPPATTDAEP